MTAWLIILFALWAFPIIGFFVVRQIQNKRQIRNQVILFLLILNILAAFGLLTNISTTLKELDWLIVTTLYLSLCILFWLGFYQQNKIVRSLAIVTMIIFFGIGYVSGSIGALGVGFVTGEYEPTVEKWIGDGIIYKETTLGNAVSDYRGKRVEIYRTLSWLPLIEWRVQNKIYNDYITIMITPLTVEYKPKDKNIYLSASMWLEPERKLVKWADTLSVRY